MALRCLRAAASPKAGQRVWAMRCFLQGREPGKDPVATGMDTPGPNCSWGVPPVSPAWEGLQLCPKPGSSLPTLPGSAAAPEGGYRSARSVSITRSLNMLSSQAGLSIDLLGEELLPFMLLLPPVPGKAQLGRPLAAPPSFSSSRCTSEQPRQRLAPQEMPQSPAPSPALGAEAMRLCPAVGVKGAEPLLSCLRFLMGQVRPAGGIPTRGATEWEPWPHIPGSLRVVGQASCSPPGPMAPGPSWWLPGPLGTPSPRSPPPPFPARHPARQRR